MMTSAQNRALLHLFLALVLEELAFWEVIFYARYGGYGALYSALHIILEPLWLSGVFSAKDLS